MSADDSQEVDFSVITRAIKCGGSTVDQILNGIHYGTSEVRCLLLDECDIIIECKVCRSLFRSLPNFIAHKRVYCLDAFEDPTEVTIPLPQGSCVDTSVVVGEPMTPEETATGDGINSSLGNATTCQEQVGGENKAAEPPESAEPTSMLEKTIQQLQEGTFEGTSEAYKFYTRVVDKVEKKEMERQSHFIRQEAIPSNPNAVRVSVVDPSDVEDMEIGNNSSHVTETQSLNGSVAGKENSPKKVSEDKQPVLRSARIREKSDRIKKDMGKAKEKGQDKSKPKPAVSAKARMNLREKAKTMFLLPLRKTAFDPKDCNIKTKTCLVCNTKFATVKSLNYHMRSHHGETRRVHPCPKCSTKFMHMWGLTRHLKRTHNLSNAQVDRMRNRLKRLVYTLPVKDENRHKSDVCETNSGNIDGHEEMSKNGSKGNDQKSPAKEKSPQQAKSPKTGSKVKDTPNESAVDPKSRAVENPPKTVKASLLTGNSVEKPKKEFSVTICSRTVTKSPQFASGLSITPCRVCGKAFARKESLQAHSLVCKPVSPTSVSESTKERMSALRASNRRRQLSPTKIDKSSASHERNSSEEVDNAKLKTTTSSPGDPVVKDNGVRNVKLHEESSVQNSSMTSSAADSLKFDAPSSLVENAAEAELQRLRSAPRQQRISSEASEGKCVEEQKGTGAKRLANDRVDIPPEPRRSMRSYGQTADKTAECSTTNTSDRAEDQSALKRRPSTRKQSSPAKSSEQCEPMGKTRKSSLSPKRPLKRQTSPAYSDVSEMSDTSASASRKSTKGTITNSSDLCDKECQEEVASNVSEKSRRTRSASQRHLSIQNVQGATKDSPSAQYRPAKAPSSPEARKTKEPSTGMSDAEVNDGDIANIVEITDEELMQVKLNTEAELGRHVKEVSRELGAMANSADGDRSMRFVEEIWVGKTPGQPPETLKSNRVFIINPDLRHKGRHICQESKIIDALIDENNLKCFHCGEAFANVSNIRRHVIRHLGWKRYRCKICTYCSYNRSEMRRHLVKLHGIAVTHITETSLDFCITDLSKGASRAKASKRRLAVTNRRAAESSGPSRERSPTPKRTVAKPEVSEINIVNSNPKRYNISTRQSPRVFDVRPFKTADAMQTLLTRKGFYPKQNTKTLSSALVSSQRTGDVRTCTSVVSESTESRSTVSDSTKRAKTKSVDFRKTRNNDNPWVDGFYKRLSGGTLGALRKEQGFHSFRKLGRSSTGTFTANLSNSLGGGGIATRNRTPKVNNLKHVNRADKSSTTTGKETASTNKHSVTTSDSAVE